LFCVVLCVLSPTLFLGLVVRYQLELHCTLLYLVVHSFLFAFSSALEKGWERVMSERGVQYCTRKVFGGPRRPGDRRHCAQSLPQTGPC
jgi:hypothetical protein